MSYHSFRRIGDLSSISGLPIVVMGTLKKVLFSA